MNRFVIGALLPFLLIPAAASGKDVSGALKSFVPMNVLPWIDNDLIVEALKTQNAVTSGYDQATIDQLDLDWRAVADNPNNKMIKSVVTGDLADFLRSKYDSSGGAIVEVIVMDARGLNVAATRTPSDYWQGDEDKFINSFGAGPAGMDFGEVEYDDSAGYYQAQVSLPIANPETGELIGAITLGIKVASLN